MTREDLVITPMTEDDIDMILVMERECFSSPWSRDSFEDVLKYPFLGGFCARIEGELAGFGIYHCLFEDSEVLDIAVGAKFRRMGIGKTILQVMEDTVRLRGAERLMLEVRKSNTGAQALYTGAGFEVTGTRRNYYKKPTEDAILMEKKML